MKAVPYKHIVGFAVLLLFVFESSASAALVSYWPLDTVTGGTTPDAAGTNTGTVNSGATATTGLIGSGALLFDNTSAASVGVGSTLAGGPTGIAVEALVKLPAAGSWTLANGPTQYDEILRKEDGNNRILFSFQNDPFSTAPAAANTPVLSLGLNIGGAYAELDMPLDGTANGVTVASLENGFHHLVGTYDVASGLKAIYVDGALAFSKSYAANSALVTSGGAVAAIGNVSVGGGEPFQGVLDEVAFYNSPLSAATVSAHYANVQAGQNYFATVPEPASGLAAVVGLIALAAIGRRRSYS